MRRRSTNGCEMVERLEGEAGPIAAGDLGDGEEGTPIIAETVESGGRHGGLAGFDGGEVVGSPAGQFTAEFGFDFDVMIVKAGKFVAGLGFHERDDDGTVVKGAGELADAGQDGRAEGPEGADGVAFAVAAVGACAAFVAGVEETAEFFGLGQPGVHFVEQESGLVLVDEAEQDGGGEVFGANGPGRESGDNVEGGGLAAAALGRGNVEAGALDEGGETVSVSVPESEGVGGAGRENKVMVEAVGDLGQDFRAVDGFGPGLRRAEGGECGLQHGVLVELVADAGDFGVEGFDADAQFAGKSFAGPVVFEGRQLSQSVDCLGIA